MKKLRKINDSFQVPNFEHPQVAGLHRAAPKRGKGKKANAIQAPAEGAKELTDEQKAQDAILIDLIDMDADDCIVPCFCFNWFFWVGFQFDFKFVVVTPHEGGTFFWTKVIDSKAAAAALMRKRKRQSRPVRTTPRSRKRTRSSPA